MERGRRWREGGGGEREEEGQAQVCETGRWRSEKEEVERGRRRVKPRCVRHRERERERETGGGEREEEGQAKVCETGRERERETGGGGGEREREREVERGMSADRGVVCTLSHLVSAISGGAVCLGALCLPLATLHCRAETTAVILNSPGAATAATQHSSHNAHTWGRFSCSSQKHTQTTNTEGPVKAHLRKQTRNVDKKH